MNSKHVGTLILVLTLTLATYASTLPTSQAQTYNQVNGKISSNITLKAADGPYSFGQVQVALGATLTIEAGASIEGGNLQVDGTLIAKGTASNKIYFNIVYVTITSTGGGSVIEYANLFRSSVLINGQATVTNSYIQPPQATTAITVIGGSPTISHNTLKGSLDANEVVLVSGGTPTFTDNSLVAFVDNGLYPNPPEGMNRFGSTYGVHVTDSNGAIVTNNNFYGPFRGATVQVDSGTATVENNNAYPNGSLTLPTPTPPPPTPTPTPTPTLPPYPPASTSATPTAPPQESGYPSNTPSGEGDVYSLVIIVVAASVAINAVLVILVAYLLKKRKT